MAETQYDLSVFCVLFQPVLNAVFLDVFSQRNRLFCNNGFHLRVCELRQFQGTDDVKSISETLAFLDCLRGMFMPIKWIIIFGPSRSNCFFLILTTLFKRTCLIITCCTFVHEQQRALVSQTRMKKICFVQKKYEILNFTLRQNQRDRRKRDKLKTSNNLTINYALQLTIPDES